MGNHSLRASATTREKPAQAPEAKETPKGQSGSIEELRKKAEKVSADPNIRAAEAIRQLDGSLETVKQLEGLTALNRAIMGVLVKLAKARVDISKIDSTKKLEVAVTTSNITLSLPEAAAVENLDRIISNGGPTAREIKDSWPDRVEAAQEAGKGMTDKYLGYWKKNPLATAALTIAGAAGIYLTYQGIKTLIGRAFEGKEKGQTEKTSWFKKEIMIPLAIMLAGSVLGVDTVKRILADCGLDYFKLEEKIKRGQELTAQEKEKLKKAKDKIEEERQSRGADDGAKAAGGVRGSSGVEGAEGAGPIAESENENEAEPEVIPESETQGPLQTASELREKMNTPDNKFRAASLFFTKVFFFERSFKGKYKANELTAALQTMRKNKIKLSRINETAKKYADAKRIPKSEFPEITQDFTDAQLYMLMDKLVIFSKLAGKTEDDPDIETIFIAVAENPSYLTSSLFHNDLVEKIKNGDIAGVFSGIDYEKMNRDIIEKVKDGSLRMADHINDKLNPELKQRFDEFSEEEKRHIYAVQGIMIAEANIRTPSQQAVEEAIRGAGNQIEKPEHKKWLIDFYESVQNKTQTLLPRLKNRYSIKEVNGVQVVDCMNEGLQFETLSFLHCTEIIIAAEGIDLDAPATEEQWMQDMALLTVLLRAMNQKERQVYLTHLGTKIANEDIGDLNIPGLDSLKPYFESVLELGKEFATEYLTKYMTIAITFADARPAIGTEAFRERLRNSPIITIGSEGLGSWCEIGRDALAFLLSAAKITPEDFANVESGEDFLDLLMSNQNTQQIVYNKENPSIIAIQIAGKWLFMKPFGIMKEAFSELAQLNPGTAIGTWVAGSALFMAAHAGWESLTFLGRVGTGGIARRDIPMKIGRILLASTKGLKYPLYPVKLTKKGIETAIRATQTAGEYGRTTRQALNWTTDLVRKHTLAQNVGNMLESGKWMRHYVENTRDLSDHTWKQAWRQLKGEKADLIKRTFGSNFNRRMALRYAIRFSEQYNHFFDFTANTHRNLPVSALRSEKDLRIAIDKAMEAHNRVRLFMKNANANHAVMDELLTLSRKGLKGSQLIDEMAGVLGKLGHLNAEELAALGKQLVTEGDVKKFISRVRDGVAYFDKVPKPGTSKPSLSERMRRPTDIEGARNFGKVKQAIHQTEKNLTDIQRRINAAENEIKLIRRMGKGPQLEAQAAVLQKRLDAARQIIADGQRAQTELRQSLQALQWVREGEEALKAAQAAGDTSKIAKAGAQLRAATELAEEAAEKSGKTLQSVGRLGGIGTGLKYAGGILGGAGAIFSAGIAVYSGYEAITTDIEGRGAVKGAEAALWGVNAAADAAIVAVMFGAEGTAATGLSSLAMPLLPITYAGVTVAETLYEDTKQDYEWIQGDPYQVLHHFYTSINTCSLGDAWVTGTHMESPDKRLEIKRKTMRKIFRGLVAIQKDPSLLNYILTEAPSKKKDKEVEERITRNYTKYHEFYFQNMHPQGLNTYESAKQYILDAQMFDDIMQARDKKRETKQPFVLVSNDKQQFSLHLDRYDIEGGIENPTPKKMYNPLHVVQAYKDGIVRLIETDDIKKDNLERMDTGYLVRLYVQIRLKLENSADRAEIEKEEGLLEFLAQQQYALEGYLGAKRGVNLVFDATRPEYHQPSMSLKAIKEHLQGFESIDNKPYLDFEKKEYSMTPALHALYKLGQYFGYGGPPSEEGLKKFFDPKGAEFRGLYWSREQWMLNERGYEFDDPFGPLLTSQMIEAVATRMRQQPDNILSHRQDAFFLDARDYSAEVRKMAQILEDGLKEGNERNYQRSASEAKQEIVAPPRAFDPQKIDYGLPKEALMADYKKVMEYIVAQTAWNNLDYKINDENSITISRKDGAATIELKRSGTDVWTLGDDYAAGLSLTQAIALGNLVNWAEQWIGKENIEGALDKPFLVSGETIAFDKNWSYFHTTFLKHWTVFYDQIGVSKGDAVNALNSWYSKKGRRR